MRLGAGATFDALGRAFLSTAAMAGAVCGERHGLRFGAVGTPIASFNRLMVTAMNPETVDRDLDDVLATLGAAPALSAWLPDIVHPSDLASRLEERGFADEAAGARVPAMTRSLADLPQIAVPAGVTVSVAASRADIVSASPVLAAGFGAPVQLMELVHDRLADALLAPGSTGRLFLVHDGTDLVATSYGWVAGDVVAIYNVVTIPAARGRGLGALATLATMQLGLELGARHAVLESTDAGYPLYRRLGFEDVGGFAVLVRRV